MAYARPQIAGHSCMYISQQSTSGCHDVSPMKPTKKKKNISIDNFINHIINVFFPQIKKLIFKKQKQQIGLKKIILHSIEFLREKKKNSMPYLASLRFSVESIVVQLLYIFMTSKPPTFSLTFFVVFFIILFYFHSFFFFFFLPKLLSMQFYFPFFFTLYMYCILDERSIVKCGTNSEL